jgi:hypothetical protein
VVNPMDPPFKVGMHTLRIVGKDVTLNRWRHRRRGPDGSPPPRMMRWGVSVDLAPVETWFASRPDAWTAGVVEADRLDHLATSGPAAGPAPG